MQHAFVSSTVGRLKVDQSDVDLETARVSEKSLNAVEQGGRWKPQECRAKAKVTRLIRRLLFCSKVLFILY